MRSIWEIVELLDHLFEHYCIEESAKLRLVELCGYWWERFDPEECGESDENIVKLLKILKSNDKVVIKGCKTGKVEIDTEFLVSSICDALPISQKQGYYKSKNGISDDVPEEDWENYFRPEWVFDENERGYFIYKDIYPRYIEVVRGDEDVLTNYLSKVHPEWRYSGPLITFM